MATETDVVKAVAYATPEAMSSLTDSGVRLSDASLNEIMLPIIENPLSKNAFFTNLYNKIIFQEVVNGKFKNPMGALKKNKLRPFGDTYERLIFNPAKAISYYNTNDNILTPALPDIKVEYIKVNREDKYPISLPYQAIQQAIMNEDSFREFREGASATLYNGDAIDEFNLMKKVISDVYKSGYMQSVEQGSDSTQLTKQIINLMKMFRFPSTKNNVYSIKYPDDELVTWTNPENVVMIIKADVMTDIMVDVLSAAFNLDKIRLMEMIIEVDEFEDEDIVAFVGDIAYFQVRDQLYQMDSFQRADDLSIKTYLHHWQAIECSMFANACCIRKNGSTAPTPSE